MARKYQQLIDQLTLEEKASMMSGKDFWQTQDIERLNIPSIFLSDGPHGLRKQQAAADNLGLNESYKATCFPTAVTVASSWDLALAEEIGHALGQEAIHQKVHVLLGPGMNIKRNPLCGRNFEYFSEDPILAGRMAAAYIKGIQAEGVSGCIKHFACNSQELRRVTCDSVLDERALREIYLTNFEIAIKESHPWTLMSSYNLVNGDYTNQNKHLNNDILRGEWNYDGVMVSDWGGEDDRVKGLLAGNELEMPFNDGDTAVDIVNAVHSGNLSQQVLDDCVDRLLDLVFKTDKTIKEREDPVNLEANHLLAQKAAEESIVLLENNGILPLDKKKSVAFFGKFIEEPRYQGAGSSLVNSSKVDKILDCIRTYDLNYIGYEPGFHLSGKKSKNRVKRAIKLAKEADTLVVFLGLDDLSEAEGIDRDNMRIPENQLDFLHELCKLDKPIVVCLSCGSAVELPFAKRVDALVHMNLTGQAGAKAILNVLTGAVNPSGKLSESYPYFYKNYPGYKYFHAKVNTAEYRESLYVGYRYYEKSGTDVLYPFGYGLSYTKFEYKDLKVDEKGATFKLKNIGQVKGKEVAQLYIRLPKSKIFRPIKELKGFAKVELEPGEEKEVFIPFDEYTFRYFNVKTNQWEIEEGDYEVLIGASTADVWLMEKIHKAGTTDVLPYDPAKCPSYFSGHVSNVNDEEFKYILGR
ncbi:MAG: glycoside hydrolase family 3 C-terminal domain-containing protein, partial [Bacilli bacterium]|nr:glycoside hydrolase family 3 C-terminal domain-containing protein [Bacilli bacterium]